MTLDGSVKWVCDVCGKSLDFYKRADGRGRRRHFCSSACKQKAYRLRSVTKTRVKVTRQ